MTQHKPSLGEYGVCAADGEPLTLEHWDKNHRVNRPATPMTHHDHVRMRIVDRNCMDCWPDDNI